MAVVGEAAPHPNNMSPLDYHQQQQQHLTNNSIAAANGSKNSPSTEEKLSIFLCETHSQNQQQTHPLRGLELLNIPPGTLQKYLDRLRSTRKSFGLLETQIRCMFMAKVSSLRQILHRNFHKWRVRSLINKKINFLQ